MENVKIFKIRNTVQLKINSNFYTKQSINETLDEFHEICKGKIKEKESAFIVKLKPKEKRDLEELGYEFMNHLFAKTKESGI